MKDASSASAGPSESTLPAGSAGGGARGFLAGGGEMGALMRARDWAATPLGPVESWPQSLKTAIRIMLTARQPIWVGWGPELLFFYNDSCLSIIDGKHPEALGRPTSIVWQEIWSRIGPVLAAAMSGDESVSTEEQLRIAARDGAPEETCYAFSYSPLPGIEGSQAGGETAGIFCIGSAIRKAEANEKERHALNETLEQRIQEAVAERDRLWELSEDLLVVAEHSGRLLRVSPSWERLLGHGRAALLAAAPTEFTHPDDRDRLLVALEQLARTGRPVHCEIRMRTIAGAWRSIAWTLSPDPDDARLHGVGRDVTADRDAALALRQTEEALRAALKMEAIGKLTGGVAHDFNNLLQVIGGNLQLLAREGGSERTQQRLRNALAGVARGSKLASQLLAFGRRQPLAPKVVNLGRFVRGLDDMLRRALGDGIEIDTVVSGGLWNTLVDPLQAETALVNLAINARDAMAGHGKLTIEAGNALLDDAYALRHADVAPGQYVVLAVTDTGCGMTRDVLEHVFEPFFTTKPEGQGTGLGLSMVYGFVTQSGGHIKINSEPGQGATIRLYLPRIRQEENLATEIEHGTTAGGSETIMVVEDDEDVRTTVVDMLSDLGYRVLKAKDAQGALAIVESGLAVDLLFTDVVMPGPLRSPELARKARERVPGIAVLFTSGYTEDAIVHGGRLDDGIELLSKPYTREALARKIRQVLRSQAQRNAAMQPPVAPPTAPAVIARTLRILVVEDDELIRFTVTEMLGMLGHEVAEAGNATEALAELDRGSFEVLLADVTLPGMSGLDLAREALRRVPELRVVFASGRAITPSERIGLERAVHLQKPYGSGELAAALKQAVAS